MKKLLASLLIILSLGGCSSTRLILVPSNQYYPIFPTKDFNNSKKYSLDIWEESEDVNGTTINYLVADKKELLGFIEDTKKLRNNYNLMLRKINEFNTKIIDLNKKQNEKKPREVKSIRDSWFFY